MDKKTNVKIIKKTDRLARRVKLRSRATKPAAEGDAKDLAKTVSSWVRDFKQRNNPNLPTEPPRQSGKRKNAV